MTTYGEEAKFGGGKTLRDGMGQSVTTTSADGDLDLVITNALVLDYTVSTRPTSALRAATSSASAMPATPTSWTE